MKPDSRTLRELMKDLNKSGEAFLEDEDLETYDEDDLVRVFRQKGLRVEVSPAGEDTAWRIEKIGHKENTMTILDQLALDRTLVVPFLREAADFKSGLAQGFKQAGVEVKDIDGMSEYLVKLQDTKIAGSPLDGAGKRQIAKVAFDLAQERGEDVRASALFASLVVDTVAWKRGEDMEKSASELEEVSDDLKEAAADQIDPWVTRDEVASLCPSCSDKMGSLGINKIRMSLLLNTLRDDDGEIKTAKKWEKLPKGWTDESLKKFWNTMTGDVKHKVTKCMKEMEGKVDDTGAFCASLADKVTGTTKWRGKKD